MITSILYNLSSSLRTYLFFLVFYMKLCGLNNNKIIKACCGLAELLLCAFNESSSFHIAPVKAECKDKEQLLQIYHHFNIKSLRIFWWRALFLKDELLVEVPSAVIDHRSADWSVLQQRLNRHDEGDEKKNTLLDKSHCVFISKSILKSRMQIMGFRFHFPNNIWKKIAYCARKWL